LKKHLAVNVRSKKILSMQVTTDEHIDDIKALPEFVDDCANVVLIDIFKFISDNGVMPCLK
jgi:hypothetical protein